MTDHRSPPPQAEACLLARYPSSQKGGTIIIEQVCSLKEHERLLNTGSYRLDACPRCGATTHLHDLRPRVMVQGAGLERVVAMTGTTATMLPLRAAPAWAAQRLAARRALLSAAPLAWIS